MEVGYYGVQLRIQTAIFVLVIVSRVSHYP